MNFDIVVAHYKENLDWIGELNHDLIRNIFVYTKSDLKPEFKNQKVCHSYLTNVGRESHTYIWHCVNRWDEISSGEPDFIFFVQGGPHGMHSKNILEWIDLISEEKLDYTRNFRISSPMEFLSNGRCRHWAGETKPASCNVVEWCEKHVRTGPKPSFPIFWNACFGVSTGLIAKSELPKYVNLIQNELADVNPECGHYCERLWYYIFNMDKSDEKGLKDTYEFWGGHDGRRHYGSIRLKKDGTVGIYNHHNETYWSSEGDLITLYDHNKKPTSLLTKQNNGEYLGTFIGLGPKSIHRLVPN